MTITTTLWTPSLPLLLALALAGPGAQAAPNTPPGAPAAHGAKVAKATRARAGFQSSDVTPPTLQAISVSGSMDLTRTHQRVLVRMDLSDDSTGVFSGVLWVQSPSGAVYEAQEFLDTDAPLHVVHTETLGSWRAGAVWVPTEWAEPGTWRVVQLQVNDLAGNTASYDADQLAALGPTTFQVSNSRYDGVSPKLLGGKILTPAVSLSQGNDAGIPNVKVSVTVSDSGQSSAAGVDYIEVLFCLPPIDAQGNCSDYFATTSYFGVPAVKRTTAVTGGIPWRYYSAPAVLAQPGTYSLIGVTLATQDGANGGCTSVLVGGSCDFSTLFPTTTVTLQP